jgi:FG-GAP-like repeat/FG-GAP repeat
MNVVSSESSVAGISRSAVSGSSFVKALFISLTISFLVLPAAAIDPVIHAIPPPLPESLVSGLLDQPTRSLSETPNWSVESNQANAFLGSAVATAGDVNGDGFSDLLVSAAFYDYGFEDNGVVWLFLGSAGGLSSEPDWSGSGGGEDHLFGFSIGTAGDVNADGYDDILVSALQYTNGQTDEGAVWLLLGSAAGPVLPPAWSAEGNQVNARFGSAVGTAGDVNGDGYDDVLIGADAYDNGQLNEGCVYLYSGGPAGLSPTPTWVGEPNIAGASFGNAVSTAGDVNADGYADVIIGARYAASPEPQEGRAYLYFGSASGLLAAPAWVYESDESYAALGYAVGTAGDLNGDGFSDVIVGAPYHPEGADSGGKIFVFLGNETGLAATPYFTSTGSTPYGYRGGSVGTAGDINGDGYADIFAGARNEGTGGYVYLFTGSANGIDPAAVLAGTQPGCGFGCAGATAGDINGDGFSDLLAGAYYWNSPESYEGAAFLFYGGGDPPALTPSWFSEGNQASSIYGKPAAAGDVNGDGFSDFLVSAMAFDGDVTLEGKAELYLGSSSGSETEPSWVTWGGQYASWYGSGIGGAGDVNGDGYSDIIVGSQGLDIDETDEGMAYVYHGSPSGPSATPDWTAAGDQIHTFFGTSTTTAGDVNGDGFADVIIGAQGYDNGENNEGAAYLYLGSEAGLEENPAWQVEGNQAEAFMGFSVSSAGDVNGDGYSDVIVGTHQWDFAGLENIGSAAVYHGSPDGLSLIPDWQAFGNAADEKFGNPVISAGDLNGDGYGDVAVGARFYNGGVGSVTVYYGSASGLDTVAGEFFFGSQLGQLLHKVSSAGDVNGDGYGDLLVGGQGIGAGAPDQGGAFVMFGSAGGLLFPPDWAYYGPANSLLGGTVSTAGDINGDGFDDILIGAAGYDGDLVDEGIVYQFLGNKQVTSNPAIALSPRQIGIDGAPIDLLGRSDGQDRVGLKLRGRTPAGRAAVRLEWSISELGVPYNAVVAAGDWQDTGLVIPGEGSATTLAETITGLTLETLYRWRVRVASNSPYFPRSPWMSMARTTPSTAQFRTCGLPVSSADENDPGSFGGSLRIEPNPVRGSATITFELSREVTIDVGLYDLTGRRVSTIARGLHSAGRQVFTWHPRSDADTRLPVGLYFLRVGGSGVTMRARVILLE